MIYLDHAATTPPDPSVIDAMVTVLRSDWGNTASPHFGGRKAAGLMESARAEVAELLGTRAQRVVFTSGATESLNTAIKGLAASRPGQRLIVGATEHKAALEAAEAAANFHGGEVVRAPVLRSGSIDLAELERLVSERPTAAVIVMAANNETGVSNSVAELGRIAQAAGVPSVVDATQQAGKAPICIDDWKIDFVAASAHKIYGPQGVGALVVPPRLPDRFVPLLHGGGHERGLRSGTLNLPGIVAFGRAAHVAVARLEQDAELLAESAAHLWRRLSTALPQVQWHGESAQRLPGYLNVRLPGVDAESLVASTPGVAFATGSACTSLVPSPSHVLLAMGVERYAADESIRLTPGRSTTVTDIDKAADALIQSARRLYLMSEATI